ncbi:MAG: DUF1549 domain-containing protein [Planctomycetota bacterium]|nr:MAG: DUF1549 domain-containing protein [Planctomycetota bacterium]
MPTDSRRRSDWRWYRSKGWPMLMSAVGLVWFTAWGVNSGHGADGGRSIAPAEMSQRVDQRIEEHLREIGWQAAGPCSDAEFIRRAYLDLTGRPPTAGQVVRFIDDPSADKRQELVSRLLRSPLHAEHLAQQWAEWLLPEADNPFQPDGRNGLRNWLRQRFAENLRYDRLVADLMVSTGPAQTGPTAFFLELGVQPEKIAARTSRVFLGIQLDCAQCHDHPFDTWTQRDFWGFAAYFAQIENSAGEMNPLGGSLIERGMGDVRLMGTDEIVPPKPLLAAGVSGLEGGTRRQQLTLWMCAPENPLLARAAVNRVWSLLFGRGLIEPVDDMSSLDAASHPELLLELSQYFADTGYDLRNLFAVLTNTRLYSRANRHPAGPVPPASYAAMPLKPLTNRQMAASLMQVARMVAPPGQDALGDLSSQLGQLRGDASEAKLGIVSALVTLHGQTAESITSEKSSRLVMALNAPHMDLHKQIRWLFLATVNRPPTDEEMQALSGAVQEAAEGRSGTSSDEQPATGESGSSPPQGPDTTWQSDLLWALLNSTEFAMTP